MVCLFCSSNQDRIFFCGSLGPTFLFGDEIWKCPCFGWLLLVLVSWSLRCSQDKHQLFQGPITKKIGREGRRIKSQRVYIWVCLREVFGIFPLDKRNQKNHHFLCFLFQVFLANPREWLLTFLKRRIILHVITCDTVGVSMVAKTRVGFFNGMAEILGIIPQHPNVDGLLSYQNYSNMLPKLDSHTCWFQLQFVGIIIIYPQVMGSFNLKLLFEKYSWSQQEQDICCVYII